MTRSRLRNFYKTEVKKIDNDFANKEIRAFHFCENLKQIILQTYTRKTLQITNVSKKPSNPSCQKKLIFLKK